MAWGEAVALVRADHKPGKITIAAEMLRKGKNTPDRAELTIESVPSNHQFVQSTEPSSGTKKTIATQDKPADKESLKALEKELEETRNELKALRIKEVERQQEEFEGVE